MPIGTKPLKELTTLRWKHAVLMVILIIGALTGPNPPANLAELFGVLIGAFVLVWGGTWVVRKILPRRRQSSQQQA